jgi:ribosomal protein L11 methyltransferase
VPRRAGSRPTGSLPALEVRCAVALADRVSGLLFEGGTSGIEEVASGRLVACFATPPTALLVRRLTAAGARVRRLGIPDVDWVLRSRRLSRPVRVSPFLIVAPWSRARARQGEVRLVIDPARAFGSGSHESTRLVLGELARRPPRRLDVLDVGTGSGILALAAAALGARFVAAIDLDPEASAAAVANAARNWMEGRIHVAQGGPHAVSGRFDLVLANLTAAILAVVAKDLAARVASGGRLLASGFVAGDAERIGALFHRHGLRPEGGARDGGWALVSFIRPGRRG